MKDIAPGTQYGARQAAPPDKPPTPKRTKPEIPILSAMQAGSKPKGREVSGRIFGLDLMRAVAVCSVLLCHTLYFLYPTTPRPPEVFIWGWIGVEIFFALSGFLIGGILLRLLGRNISFPKVRTFWLRRAFRTLPNYYVFFVINLMVAWLTSQVVPNVWPFLILSQNLAWRIPPFYVESWTLSMEECFYLFVPLAFLLHLGLRISVKSYSLLVILGLIVVVTITRAAVVEVNDTPWFWTLSTVVLHADALMFGVLAAWLKANFDTRWTEYRFILAATGIVLIGLATWANFHHTSDSIYYFSRTTGMSIASIGICMLLPSMDGWKTCSGRLARGIQFLSLWSYSLYLCQVPIMNLVQHFLVVEPADSDGRHFGLVGSYVVACIAFAAFWFRNFEKPMTDLRDRFS